MTIRTGGNTRVGDTSQPNDFLLELDDVHMFFGKVTALAGVKLKIRKGEIHSVIGPNGAGKTVMMNCISGLYKPQKGAVHFNWPADQSCQSIGTGPVGYCQNLSESRGIWRHDGT